MAQGDINQLMAWGGVQRQLAQQVLDAQRQSTLQQQYEPYQRAEFLSNLYAAGPKSIFTSDNGKCNQHKALSHKQ
jgi:hypothetical protein